ncbi:DHHW family protein [Demequina aestuarii]|uniref:DHHW family protein n=1 Tax=Demequina aestuarii TaxID=327095 RepID=UPI0007852704|nr:DHHW family protein [Demequina aestuarii]
MADTPSHAAPRRRTLLVTLLPAVALLAVVVVGLVGLSLRTEPRASNLDGRDLVEFPAPDPDEPVEAIEAVIDKSWMAGVEDWAGDQIPGRATWLSIHAVVQTDVLQDPVVDDVYMDGPDGFLFERHLDRSVPENMATNAQALSDQLAEADIPLMWIYAPRKEELRPEVTPEAWGNDLIAERPNVMAALDTGDPMLDLTQTFDDPELFRVQYFRNDHHWTADAAALAVQEAAELARAELDVDIPDDARSYERVIYDDAAFYGTLGRRVTAPVTPGKDFLSWLEPEGGFSARQCLDDACDSPLINTYRLEEDSLYANRYRVFLGGDSGLLRIVNEDAPSDTTAVLLKDSYGNPFAMYLAERVRELYVIDERHYDGDLEMTEFAADVDADIMMVLHNQVSLLGVTRFDSTSWVDVKGASTYEEGD